MLVLTRLTTGECCRANALSVTIPAMMPSEGHVLADRFVLVHRLGEGGFDVVYEGRDLRDGGRIALKLLRRSEPAWLVSFKREFRALAGIRHPNLVALDQLFSHEDQWFFSMELVDGVNFLEYVRGRSFTRQVPVGPGKTSTLLPELPHLPADRDERHAPSPDLVYVRLRVGRQRPASDSLPCDQGSRL